MIRDQASSPQNTMVRRIIMKTRKPNFLTLTAIALVGSLVMLLVFGASGISARQQQITGTENHIITLDQAVKYIQNYTFSPTAPTTKGGLFARSIFDKILSQPGCIGVRYYYAKKDDGTPTLVLVGVDAGGNDLPGGILGEDSFPCPPFCGAPGQLNK
jgi:hypothetical protein